jgi:O-antigen/teichoic acid export membrane protein
MSIAQANFRANLVAFSEIARSVLFISFAVLFAGFYDTSVGVETLFSFQLLSYTVSMLIILFFVPRKIFDKTSFSQKQMLQQLGKIMSYGGYLFIWFFTSYLIANGNRFVLSSYWGKSSIGEFTAVFDMISKSIVMMLSPVLLSIFPIAVKAFESGQFDSVNKTISRIIRIELLVMFFIVVCYYLFGYQILAKLLKIEQDRYKDTGVLIVIATFIWQISMVKQKILELTMKIGTMVKFIVISLMVTFSLDLYFCRLGDSYAIIGFLFGAMTYYGLCHRYCANIFSSTSKVNC